MTTWTERARLETTRITNTRAILLLLVLVPLIYFADKTVYASGVGFAATGLIGSLGWAASIGSISIRQPDTLVIPVTISVLAVWLSIRNSPWLLMVDIICALALVSLGPSIRGWGDVFTTERFGWVTRFRQNAASVWTVTSAIGSGTGKLHKRLTSSELTQRISLKAALTSASTAAILLALLASGDAVFASFFTAPGVGWTIPHLIIWAWAAFVGLWLAFASFRPRDEHRRYGAVATSQDGSTMVLGTVTGVLALFSISQVITLAQGRDWVLDRTGLTFAEYARRGFFQLLLVAGIVLTVLVVTRMTTAADYRRPPRRIVALSTASALLTVGLVAVSLRRMFLYEDAFGLTMLRLYVVGFALWMAALLVATATATATARDGRRWLATFVVGSAVAGVLALNLMNPEAIVVDRNLDRAEAGAVLDLDYLTDLSSDGRLALLDRAESNPTGQIAAALCMTTSRFPRPAIKGFWSYNFSVDLHEERMDELCGQIA
ncbi:MAG: DUF4173 domain-containing protein [Actinomycetia bacterium]|nr:DUF4173 domain-containing protein [Actinomycetes bacterium]